MLTQTKRSLVLSSHFGSLPTLEANWSRGVIRMSELRRNRSADRPKWLFELETHFREVLAKLNSGNKAV